MNSRLATYGVATLPLSYSGQRTFYLILLINDPLGLAYLKFFPFSRSPYLILHMWVLMNRNWGKPIGDCFQYYCANFHQYDQQLMEPDRSSN